MLRTVAKQSLPGGGGEVEDVNLPDQSILYLKFLTFKSIQMQNDQMQVLPYSLELNC